MAKWVAPRCKNGHQWTDDNTYLYMDTKGHTRRKCRACTLRRLQAQRADEQVRAKRARQNRAYKLTASTPRSLVSHERELIRANTLLSLHEQLERETRAWMRPELKARIKELTL